MQKIYVTHQSLKNKSFVCVSVIMSDIGKSPSSSSVHGYIECMYIWVCIYPVLYVLSDVVEFPASSYMVILCTCICQVKDKSFVCVGVIMSDIGKSRSSSSVHGYIECLCVWVCVYPVLYMLSDTGKSPSSSSVHGYIECLCVWVCVYPVLYMLSDTVEFPASSSYVVILCACTCIYVR